MGITKKVWIKYRDTSKLKLKEPIVIVGASGLRSVGKIAVDVLIEKLHPLLFAELYSYGFPCIYYGPSYVGAPCAAGAKMLNGNLVELPKVDFYILENENIIITRGYQAYDALNQYQVADKVTDLFKELHVKKQFSLGAQVIEKGIRCCASDPKLLEEMSKYKIKRTNVELFIGFSGLVVAMGKEKGIKGICLFGSTTQNLADVEHPDFYAAKELLDKLGEILNLSVDTSDLEKRRHVVKELEEEKREQGEGRREEELSGYL
jgi:proteasome assembly chaperone (PAC2) family protein